MIRVQTSMQIRMCIHQNTGVMEVDIHMKKSRTECETQKCKTNPAMCELSVYNNWSFGKK